MNRIGLIRLDRENLPVDLLGSLQPAGLMVLDRNRQCFGNRCHNRISTLDRCSHIMVVTYSGPLRSPRLRFYRPSRSLRATTLSSRANSEARACS